MQGSAALRQPCSAAVGAGPWSLRSADGVPVGPGDAQVFILDYDVHHGNVRPAHGTTSRSRLTLP